LPGESFASRVAASLLNTIGLPELIASNSEQYEALAIDLASNPDKLSALKASLMAQQTASPLFDTKDFTKNLEAAYLKMYERYQANLQPEHLILPD
jgi:predicted O-linked N-acetylglucosamine transferase (SPINDLY family)